MHKAEYSSTTHDVVNGTQTAVVEGGRFLSLISGTAPSSLIAGAQRQPAVKGRVDERAASKERRKRKEGRKEERRRRKGSLYLFGYIKCPGGILIKGSNHLRVSQLLTLSLRLSPITPKEKTNFGHDPELQI
ncbi:unnamed protein product [Pleuronectes platessa]|uniref:Uncharacterized protein n=1 Tax=Pleuronectes platessa TaxID=8262 RepID=A0A9N7V3U3_PLEPL|nr:unnamed protein product [Pleuronectes platessa]